MMKQTIELRVYESGDVRVSGKPEVVVEPGCDGASLGWYIEAGDGMRTRQLQLGEDGMVENHGS